jgi:UDP-4-amino-4,6-dideoxy-N-acetyl-beta-L-altrosamine N-acetyltransferase
MNDFLVPLSEKEIDLVRIWRNDPRIRKFMFSRELISEQNHKCWFEKNKKISTKQHLLYKQGGEFKGFVQLDKLGDSGEIYEWGFYTAPGSEKGIGSRMASLVFSHLFLTCGAHRLVAKVISFNKPSVRLHEKLGFKLEGILRKHHCIDGIYHDVFYYGILASEWNNGGTKS